MNASTPLLLALKILIHDNASTPLVLFIDKFYSTLCRIEFMSLAAHKLEDHKSLSSYDDRYEIRTSFWDGIGNIQVL